MIFFRNMNTHIVHVECFQDTFQVCEVCRENSILKCSEKGRLKMAFISIFLHFDELRLSRYLRLPKNKMWHVFSVLE